MMIRAPAKQRITVEGLLGRGYFPPELPPPFRTRSFASTIANTRLTALPQQFTQKKNEWCDFVAFSLSRPGSLRRRLALLNPVAYYRLAKFVVDHQQKLLKQATASHISLAKAVAGKPASSSGPNALTQFRSKERRCEWANVFFSPQTSAAFILRSTPTR